MKKILLILCLFLSGCNGQMKETNMYSRMSLSAGFDTFMALNGEALDEETFNKQFNEFENKTYSYHQLFDKYHNYDGINNIKTINDNAGIKPVQVDEEILELVLLAKEYYEFTDGKFDITLGPVLNLWHEFREKVTNNEQVSLPTTEQLKEAKACSGWDKVEIDEQNNTIYLNSRCASLDVGGIAKGFTAEKMAQYMEKLGIHHGYINAGGNIRVIGNKLNNEGWIVGTQVPISGMEKYSLAAVELVEGQSMVTSGYYQRYVMYENEMYHHIIDPDTLYPAKHCASVTVITNHSGLADIFSTLFYTCSYQEGKELVNKLREKNIEIEVIWIYDTLNEISNEEYKTIELTVEDQLEKKYYILTTLDQLQIGNYSVNS